MSELNSETIGGVILVRDAVLVSALKFNKRIQKHQFDYGVRGEYAIIKLGRGSLVDPQTTDDIQAEVADMLGRKCYQDPDYVPGVVATFRVNIEGLENLNE